MSASNSSTRRSARLAGDVERALASPAPSRTLPATPAEVMDDPLAAPQSLGRKRKLGDPIALEYEENGGGDGSRPAAKRSRASDVVKGDKGEEDAVSIRHVPDVVPAVTTSRYFSGPPPAAPRSPTRPMPPPASSTPSASPGRRTATHIEDATLEATPIPAELWEEVMGMGSGGGAGDAATSASPGRVSSGGAVTSPRASHPSTLASSTRLYPPGIPSRALLTVPSPLWPVHRENIVKMRCRRDAPVDSMGCERCADPGADPRVQRFQNLVSLMLSSQTKDEVTFAATKRLIEGLACSPEGLASPGVSEGDIAALISSVGFWRNKAKFIKASAGIIVEKWGGEVPNTMAGLLSLPGVGPKMATIALQCCWDVAGIGVDVHVHRIANRLGWVKSSTPIDTQKALESLIPRHLWGGVNIDLVGFGQQVCLPLGPSCNVCLNRDICPVGAKLKSADAWKKA